MSVSHDHPAIPVRPPDGTGHEVLIVDDSRVQRRILAAQLNRAGYQVIEAASAEEALERCRTRMPEIIISDWTMPGMSGLALCQRIRECQIDDYVYFILLTSRAEATEVAAGLDAGADDFLTKPIAGDELRARIASGRRLLRMQGELQEKNRLLQDAFATLQKVHDRIDRDLNEARRLQQGLMRERQRRFGRSEVNLVLRPCGHVGGDLVGFFPINARRLGLYAIDVSGHGIASALMTARIAGYFSGNAPELNVAVELNETGGYDPVQPAEVAAELNDILLHDMRGEIYFTMAYADIDLITGHVSLVQAGHPHPLIRRACGTVEPLGAGGLPIGLISGAEYQTVSAVLNPGDRLILVSDGITELVDADGIMLDDAGLASFVTDLGDLEGGDFGEALMERLSRMNGGDFADDVSAVVFDFERMGPEMNPRLQAPDRLRAAAFPAQRPVAMHPVSR